MSEHGKRPEEDAVSSAEAEAQQQRAERGAATERSGSALLFNETFRSRLRDKVTLQRAARYCESPLIILKGQRKNI